MTGEGFAMFRWACEVWPYTTRRPPGSWWNRVAIDHWKGMQNGR
jgi:hypothetical protein